MTFYDHAQLSYNALKMHGCTQRREQWASSRGVHHVRLFKRDLSVRVVAVLRLLLQPHLLQLFLDRQLPRR